MGRLIVFAGVLIVAVTILPSVYVPHNVGWNGHAFMIADVRGGVICYHGQHESCPHIPPPNCAQFWCYPTYSGSPGDGDPFDPSNYHKWLWSCSERVVINSGYDPEHGAYEDIIFEDYTVEAQGGSMHFGYIVDQEPGFKEKTWNGLVHCRKIKTCSGCVLPADCFWGGDIPFEQHCEAPSAGGQNADSRENWLLSGCCYDE